MQWKIENIFDKQQLTALSFKCKLGVRENRSLPNKSGGRHACLQNFTKMKKIAFLQREKRTFGVSVAGLPEASRKVVQQFQWQCKVYRFYKLLVDFKNHATKNGIICVQNGNHRELHQWY